MAPIIISNKRVRASSVLEVIISMVIILLIFGIAMTIFTNVTRTSLSARKLRAEAVIRKTMLQTEQADAPGDQLLKIDDLQIEITVKATVLNSKLNEISIIAYDENKQIIAQLQKLIISRHD
ncbi:MAG: hypothetical protein V4592_04825 [Bacteroidota bacterium]